MPLFSIRGHRFPNSSDADEVGEGPDNATDHPHPQSEWWGVPLMRGTAITERPANQNPLSQRYAEEATAFIRAHREEPVFLLVAHGVPPLPLFRPEAFEGGSRRALHGDGVEQVNWTLGQIMEGLRDTGQAQSTLFVFISDDDLKIKTVPQTGSEHRGQCTTIPEKLYTDTWTDFLRLFFACGCTTVPSYRGK